MTKVEKKRLSYIERNNNIDKIYKDIAITCHLCDEAYCCKNQKGISITDIEAEVLIHYVDNIKLDKATEEKELKGTYTCPLLNDDNRCTVYEFRPLVCAVYSVLGNKHKCNSIFEQDVDVAVVRGIYEYIKTDLVLIDMISALNSKRNIEGDDMFNLGKDITTYKDYIIKKTDIGHDVYKDDKRLKTFNRLKSKKSIYAYKKDIKTFIDIKDIEDNL